MPRLCALRCVCFVVLAIILPPMTISCSGGKTPKQGDDKNNDTPEASQLNKVIADYTEAIRLNPKDANARGELAYLNRGRAYAQKDEHDKAIADYTEALRLYPIVNVPFLQARLIEAHDARGKSYQKKGEYDKAIADYTEVIQIGTGSFKDMAEAMAFGGLAAQAYYKRGVCYDEKGEHGKAVSDYKEAIRMAPELKDNDDLKARMSK